jgi:hypothetical protein
MFNDDTTILPHFPNEYFSAEFKLEAVHCEWGLVVGLASVIHKHEHHCQGRIINLDFNGAKATLKCHACKLDLPFEI